MRVVVTGGGTGGHIYPAIAVCEAVRHCDPSGDVLYIGGSSGMETDIVPAAGVPFQAVTARKMPASLSLATVRGYLALSKGYLEAKTYLRAFKTDVVVGTGGYVAAATVFAASRMGIPTLILENNLVPGRTNLKLGGKAKKICVSFQETIARFPAERCVLTGLPLREGIVAPAQLTKQEARSRFSGLFADRFTVLVIGGSQGARAINGLILEAAPALMKKQIQILHQTGPKNAEEVTRAASQAGLMSENSGYIVRPFIESDEIPAALRCSDIIVCRGGISTLSEATANGLPALIIPLPTAYADHQTANARAMERLGAAICRPEAELTGAKLANDILNLHDRPDELARMANAARALGRPNAAHEVAQLALELVH